MTGLLVHVGFPKTGTSFLQETVWSRHVGLRLIGPAGPGLPPPVQERSDVMALKRGQLDPDVVASLSEIAHTSRQIPTIISVESLIGDYFNGCRERLSVADDLAEHLPGASILLTIRNQPALLASLYSQYVHEGGYASTETFFRGNAAGAESFNFQAFEFHRVVIDYTTRFGPDRVMVMLAEQLRARPEEMASRTLRRVGLGLPTDVDWRERPNATIHPAGRYLLRLGNRLFRESGFNKRALLVRVQAAGQLRHFLQLSAVAETFSWLPGKGVVPLPRWLQDRQEELYGESNRMLAELLGVDLKAFGYP